MQFQIFTTSQNISLEKLDRLHKIKNVYVTMIQDCDTYVYILDDPNTKEEVLKKIAKEGLSVEPLRYEKDDGSYDNLYTDEKSIQKHFKKVKETVEVKVGDIVNIKGYKKMPFVVKDISENVLTVRHRLKDIELSFEVDNSHVLLEENPKSFYKNEAHLKPIPKIFIDCDIYEEGIDNNLALLKDMLSIKFVFKGYEIVVLNPLSNQKELLEVLGIRSYRGNKQIILSTCVDRKLDKVLTESLYLSKYVESIILWSKDRNVFSPKTINSEDLHFDEKDIPDIEDLPKNIEEYTKEVFLDKLSYNEVKDYMGKNKYDSLLGDLSYFIRTLKT